MRHLPVLFCLALSALSTSCAVTEKKGILVNVEPGTPMDESDLRQHCDLEDKAACALAGLKNVPLPTPHFSIVQGVAPSDRAVFAALVPKDGKISWYIYDRPVMRLTKLFTVKPVSRGGSRWAIQRVDAQGLLPNREYELLAGDDNGNLLEDRIFHPFDTDERRLRVAVFGGWRFGTPALRAEALAEAMTRQPQLLVFAGSTVDATLPEKLAKIRGKAADDFFFARQAEARSFFEPGFARVLAPAATVWNDDEFGHPEGDRSFPQRDQAREQLELFFPHWADEIDIIDGPGTSLLLTFRRQQLALLDDLSFRVAPVPGEPLCRKAKGRRKEICRPGKATPPPAGTRYGGILKDWVNDRAEKAAQPLWLLTGGPTLLPYRKDWNEKKEFDSPAFTQPSHRLSLGMLTSESDDSLRLSPR